MQTQRGTKAVGGPVGQGPDPGLETATSKVHLTIMGKELIYKKVTKSGKSGRVYLPLEWVGKTVKVVRVD
ncbi:MAG: DUF2080 family transposase-associated protein [Desulfarculus sp.]|nr:DUF2080 family transposase-associated protein [Desulfarculus sp.]